MSLGTPENNAIQKLSIIIILKKDNNILVTLTSNMVFSIYKQLQQTALAVCAACV